MPQDAYNLDIDTEVREGEESRGEQGTHMQLLQLHVLCLGCNSMHACLEVSPTTLIEADF